MIKVFFGGLVTLALMGFVSLKIAERRHLKGFLPPAFGNVTVLGTTRLVAGLGPGGHDAVLAFFELPDDVASIMMREGVGWLQSAETSAKYGRARQEGEWISTPLNSTSFAWTNAKNCQSEWNPPHAGHVCPGIAAYLEGYGFLGKLAVSKTEVVDEILFTEGSYISKRRVGYLIISPQKRLVVFAHAG